MGIIRNKTGRIAAASLLASLAILLGYVEYLIPVVPPIAGIKLGLGNIAVLAAMLWLDSDKTAFFIMLTKITLSSVLFSGLGGMAYSAAGGVCSIAVMMALRREDKLSAAGISCAGGAAHMAAQTMVAAWATSTPDVLFLLPVLTCVGTVTGFLNGIVVNLATGSLKKYLTSGNY
jgi:Predicted membrane protein